MARFSLGTESPHSHSIGLSRRPNVSGSSPTTYKSHELSLCENETLQEFESWHLPPPPFEYSKDVHVGSTTHRLAHSSKVIFDDLPNSFLPEQEVLSWRVNPVTVRVILHGASAQLQSALPHCAQSVSHGQSGGMQSSHSVGQFRLVQPHSSSHPKSSHTTSSHVLHPSTGSQEQSWGLGHIHEHLRA